MIGELIFDQDFDATDVCWALQGYFPPNFAPATSLEFDVAPFVREFESVGSNYFPKVACPSCRLPIFAALVTN